MRKTVLVLFGGLVLALGTVLAVFFVGMRRKSPPVLDAVRRMNRSVGNPRQMASAGKPGASTAVVRHVGRTSGTPYETPIDAMPTDDGFLVALPYGGRADWLKNVLASGSAVIVRDGLTYEVGQPELVATDSVLTELPPKQLRALRLFHVDQCLRLRHREADAPRPCDPE